MTFAMKRLAHNSLTAGIDPAGIGLSIYKVLIPSEETAQ